MSRMTMHLRLVGLGAAALCAWLPLAAQAQPEATRDEAQQEKLEIFMVGGVDVGKSPEEAKKKFGPAQSEKLERVANLHQPQQMDEVVDLTFKGVSVTFYCVRSEDGSHVCLRRKVAVTGRAVKVQEGLGAGAEAKAVRAALGPPDEEKAPSGGTDSTMTYVPFRRGPIPDEETTIVISLKSGRITKLVWTFALD